MQYFFPGRKSTLIFRILSLAIGCLSSKLVSPEYSRKTLESLMGETSNEVSVLIASLLMKRFYSAHNIHSYKSKEREQSQETRSDSDGWHKS